MLNRYFHEGEIKEGQTISLEEKEAHHLIKVMRATVGSVVEIVNGNGDLAQASATELTKKEARLFIQKVHHSQKPSFEVIVAQAMPKLNRLDFILEKGTELGMTQLWFFPGDRSEKTTLSTNQEARLHTITIAAMKQCGRLYLPQITLLPQLQKWPKQVYQAYFGDVHPDAPPFEKVWKQTKHDNGVIFFVGPESGFSSQEIKLLRSRHHAQGVKLHSNVLRTDTASLTALSLIHHWLM